MTEKQTTAEQQLGVQAQLSGASAPSEPFIKIIVVDLNNKEIPLTMIMFGMVFQLRDFLAEHIYTCLFTNFYFEHSGERLNEYA